MVKFRCTDGCALLHLYQCFNFHRHPVYPMSVYVVCFTVYPVYLYLRYFLGSGLPRVGNIHGPKKWIHGVSIIYTSLIHYVSDTPRVSSGYPMYPVYPYVSLCITPCILCICLNSKMRFATKFVIFTKPTFVSHHVNNHAGHIGAVGRGVKAWRRGRYQGRWL